MYVFALNNKQGVKDKFLYGQMWVIEVSRILVLLLMLWAFCARAQTTPTITYRIDTVELDIRNIVSPVCHLEISDAVVYNDMAYCLFKEYCVNGETKSSYMVVIDLASGKKDIQRYRSPYYYHGKFVIQDGTVVYHNKRDSVMATYDGGRWIYSLLPKCYLGEANKEEVRTLFSNSMYQVDFIDYGEWGDYSWVWHIPSNKHLLYPMRLFTPVCLGDTLYMKNQAGIFVLEPSLIGKAKKGFCSANECRSKEKWWFLYQFYGDPRKHDLENQEKKYKQIGETFRRNLSDTICQSLMIAKYPTWPWEAPADTSIYSLFALDGRLGAVAFVNGELQVALIEGQQITPLIRLEKMGEYRGVKRHDDGGNNTLRFRKSNIESTLLHIDGGNIHQIVIQLNEDTLASRTNDSFDTILTWLRQHYNDITPEQIDLMETTHGSASDRMQWDTLNGGIVRRLYYQNLTKGLQNETIYYLDSMGRLDEVIWDFKPKRTRVPTKNEQWPDYAQSVKERIIQELGRGIMDENGRLSWWKKEGSFRFFKFEHQCRLTFKPKRHSARDEKKR